MLLGDVGHGAQKPLEQDKYSWQQAGNFIDSHLGVATEGVPPAAASFPTLCPGTGPHVPLTSDNWDTLVKVSPRTFASAALPLRQTDSLSSDVEEEMASEPFANAGRCIERPADKSASGAFLALACRQPVHDAGSALRDPSVQDDGRGHDCRREAVGHRA